MFVCCWLGDVEIMENEHIANKHLTYEERQFIEIGLNNEIICQLSEGRYKRQYVICRFRRKTNYWKRKH